ncbi:hypothetical protein [Pseudomonas frederiksbergensis]|jgi:hypothetical protein|uniref:hypothetical protein n=1 Tax=Pseudomonas frederiksbergensis TaxID=104087 RepID=UPI003D201B32
MIRIERAAPRIKAELALLVLLLTTLPANAEDTKSCTPPQPVRKSFSNASSKPAEQKINEIVVLCGATTSSQSFVENKDQTKAKEEPKTSTPIDKLLEAIAKILASISWPIAAVTIAYHFKKELAALLTRLKKFKAGAAEAEFSELLRETEEDVDIVRTPEAQAITPEVIEGAATNPRGTILSAWIEVETAIRQLYDSKAPREMVLQTTLRPARGPLQLMREIQRTEILDHNYIALFHDLRTLRNDAAHDIDFNPPPGEVVRYIQLARELTVALKKAAEAN